MQRLLAHRLANGNARTEKLDRAGTTAFCAVPMRGVLDAWNGVVDTSSGRLLLTILRFTISRPLRKEKRLNEVGKCGEAPKLFLSQPK